jgi:hypothetical protein
MIELSILFLIIIILLSVAVGWHLTRYWNQEAVIEPRSYNTDMFGGLYELWEEVERQWKKKGNVARYGVISMQWDYYRGPRELRMRVVQANTGKKFYISEVSHPSGDYDLTKFYAEGIVFKFEREVERSDADA